MWLLQLVWGLYEQPYYTNSILFIAISFGQTGQPARSTAPWDDNA